MFVNLFEIDGEIQTIKFSYFRKKSFVKDLIESPIIEPESIGNVIKFNISLPQPQEKLSVSINETKLTEKYNANGLKFVISLYTFYKVFFSSQGGLVIDNKLIIEYSENLWVFIGRNSLVSGKVSAHYTDLICLGWSHSRGNYGHTFIDFLQPFLMIPEDIRRSSKVVMNGITNVAKEVFDLLDVPYENRVEIKDGTFVAIDRCYYYLNPPLGLSCYGISVVKMRNLFFEKFKLDHIRPEKICYTNRKLMTSRSIHNMDEIIKTAQLKWPKTQWFILDNQYKKLKIAARNWCAAKFVFMPNGSNAINTIFMHPGTVIVIVQTLEHEEEFLPLFYTALGIFNLQYKGISTDHFFGTGSKINVKLAIEMIEHGFYCLENHKWPADLK